MTKRHKDSDNRMTSNRNGLALFALTFTILISGCTTGTSASLPDPSTIGTLQNTVAELESELTAKTRAITDITKKLEKSNSELAALQAETAAAETATAQTPVPSSAPNSTTALLAEAMTVVNLLSAGDMANLAPHVHPTLGVRFSAYPFVDASTDIVLTSAQIATSMTSTIQYTWGTGDGSGDPIILDYASYHAAHVYDEDYANPDVIGIDNVIGTGNTTDNLATVYSPARFVDFHFYGFDPQYGGIDWSSLRLVFEQVGTTWYLIGVVHGQWTI